MESWRKILIKCYGKYKTLIDEVYKSKLDKKAWNWICFSQRLTRIFFYNNLSAINWIAIEKGEDRICEITTELGTFYRTALNKGINVDHLNVEVENIKAYVKLQLMAHDEGFDVEYKIESSLLDEMVPILFCSLWWKMQLSMALTA